MMEAQEFDPVPGAVDRPEPGLRRILAANPSPMTFRGTNSYILGEGRVAIIDPGPLDPDHLEALLAALAPGETVSHILITHSHLDHSPLAAPLAVRTGAPVLAFGPSDAGRSPLMTELLQKGLRGGGEGVDQGFRPDVQVTDGQVIEGDGWRVTALWTPGHFGNHLSFAWDDAVFTGDHVMGWATSMVSPPDGDVAAFMRSTERLARREDRVYYPGHGAPVPDPGARARDLLAHRQRRETQILSALSPEGSGVTELTRRIYHDTPAALLPAAQRNVFAHLVDLTSRNIVTATPDLATTALFRLA